MVTLLRLLRLVNGGRLGREGEGEGEGEEEDEVEDEL
jgi:hypothetical protein